MLVRVWVGRWEEGFEGAGAGEDGVGWALVWRCGACGVVRGVYTCGRCCCDWTALLIQFAYGTLLYDTYDMIPWRFLPDGGTFRTLGKEIRMTTSLYAKTSNANRGILAHSPPPHPFQ